MTAAAARKFAESTSDGRGAEHYDQAEVFLVGPSGVGRTSAARHLVETYGLFVADVPLAYGLPNEDKHYAGLLCAQKKQRQNFIVFVLTCDVGELKKRRQKTGRWTAAPRRRPAERDMDDLLGMDALEKRLRAVYIDTTNLSPQAVAAQIHTRYMRHMAALGMTQPAEKRGISSPAPQNSPPLSREPEITPRPERCVHPTSVLDFFHSAGKRCTGCGKAPPCTPIARQKIRSDRRKHSKPGGGIYERYACGA